jgi:hypothetical protein
MRKKYNTLEEVRQAAATRAKRWRAENKYEVRVKKAQAYGTRTVKAHVEGFGTVDIPEWVLAVGVPDNTRVTHQEPEKSRSDDEIYDPDPEDARTGAEDLAAEQEASRRSGRGPAARVAKSAPSLGAAEVKAAEDLARLQARRKAKGVPVELEGV